MGIFNPDFSKLDMNPIRKFRDDHRMTVTELYRETGVKISVIRDLEAGQLQTIPFGLRKFFAVQIPGFSIDTHYQAWRHTKRSLVYMPPVGELKISNEEHPFTQYRRKISVSLSSLCAFLCVPRFVVGKWETSQRRMPRNLKEALKEAHLSELDVRKLSNYGEIFYATREEARISEQAAHSR